jgi:flavodoxin
MNTLVIYDSQYGNTEKIALAIGDSIKNQVNAKVMRVGDVSPDQFTGIKLLIVGSPTQRFRPTAAISNLLKSLPKNSLTGVKVAAFDTRLTEEEINKTPALAFLVKLIGNVYAAKPISDDLKKLGGELIIPPEGFFVVGMEGPIVPGEFERSASWAKSILATIS